MRAARAWPGAGQSMERALPGHPGHPSVQGGGFGCLGCPGGLGICDDLRDSLRGHRYIFRQDCRCVVLAESLCHVRACVDEIKHGRRLVRHETIQPGQRLHGVHSAQLFEDVHRAEPGLVAPPSSHHTPSCAPLGNPTLKSLGVSRHAPQSGRDGGSSRAFFSHDSATRPEPLSETHLIICFQGCGALPCSKNG